LTLEINPFWKIEENLGKKYEHYGKKLPIFLTIFTYLKGILGGRRPYKLYKNRIIPYNFNTFYKTLGVPLIGIDIAKFNPSKGD